MIILLSDPNVHWQEWNPEANLGLPPPPAAPWILGRGHSRIKTFYLFFPSDSRKINGPDVKGGPSIHDPLKYKLIKIYLASDLLSKMEQKRSDEKK